MQNTAPKPKQEVQSLTWHTEKRRIKELAPFERNPRTISTFQARKLEDGLKKYNLVEIPAIDTDNKIIAGHQRIKILILLGRGEEEIDVRVPNRKLTPEEFEGYNLSSNAIQGEWDFELLKSFDTDILLDIFDDVTLTHIFDEQLSIENDGFDFAKAVAEITTPKTKPGELYKLGSHFLLCGDATDPAVIKRLVGQEKIDMVYSDSPYNIDLNYNSGIGGTKNYGGKTDDKKPDAEFAEFLRKTLQNALAVVKPSAHIFYYCDESYIWLIQTLYRELRIDNKRVCLWVKNSQNPTPQVAFNKAYEPVIYGTVGSPYLAPAVTNLTEILNKEIGSGNRLPDDILDTFSIWLAKRVPGQEYTHPTEKPASLHEKPLRRCTKPGDTVLDLFAGSGSTMSACEQLKRRAFLCEIEPIFCDVIIKRFETLTGKEAVKIHE